MTARHLHTLGGLVFAAGGATLLYGSSQMPYYTSIGPGPGFFPFWLSLLLLVLGIFMAIGAIRSSAMEHSADFWPDKSGVWRMLAILAAIALAALGLDTLGFPLTMLSVNLVILIVLGLRRPLMLVTTALLCSLGVYLVFSHWLMVELPAGIFPL